MTIESAIYTSRNEEAVEIYIKAFGLTKGYTAHSADGKLVYSKLMNGDEHFISVVPRDNFNKDPDELYIPSYSFQPYAQLSVDGLGLEGVKKAYEILKKDAIRAEPLGPLDWDDTKTGSGIVDKFGYLWWTSE
ncbi:MAG: hypothetical protein FWC16_10720 [Defluviitaleaceae bacterium]|nr:hypothetical protein [Defluviitaleaceae bacterium]MCL2275390.1 hypothetical protein [Defluviitaleaceae bacterium]